MAEKIRLVCANCNEPSVLILLSNYRFYTKNNPDKKFYCSRTCIDASRKTGKILNCDCCGKEIYITYKKSINGRKHFCSKSCSSKYNYKFKTLGNGQTKQSKCFKCSVDIIVPKKSRKKVYCDSCYKQSRAVINAKNNPKFYNLYYKIHEEKCIICANVFITKRGKYCDSCRKEVQRLNGIKNSKAVHKYYTRSKNEIYFAELCKTKFNILENEKIFNGWDADIIIPELKIAVLWDGNWHHKNHKLNEIQNRDRIKRFEIIKCGYTPYTINDFNCRNKKFVMNQFLQFIVWVENNFIANKKIPLFYNGAGV